MEIKSHISLDFARLTQKTTVYAKQSDGGTRSIEITPLENGQPFIIEEGITARINMKKPDGNNVMNDCEISEGKIIVQLTSQMLHAFGIGIADIGLYKGDTLLSSTTFYITIEKAAMQPDDGMSSDEFHSLEDALLYLDTAIENVNEVIQRVYDSEGLANQVDAQILAEKEMIAQLENIANMAQRLLTDLSAENEEAAGNIETLTAKLLDANDRISTLTEKIKGADTAANALQEITELAVAENGDLLNTIEAASTEKAKLETEIASGDNIYQKLQQAIGTALAQDASLQNTISQAGGIKSALESATTAAEIEYNALDAKIQSAISEGMTLTSTTTAATDAGTALQEKIDAATDLTGQLTMDTTLSLAGKAADARATGDAIASLNSEMQAKYTDRFFENYFALQRTGKVYTVRYPLWDVSHTTTGEKLDSNAGLVVEPSTLTEAGRNDYENIPLFKTYDCNAEIVDGVIKVTAMAGDANYNPKVNDTFVLGMPYYEREWADGEYSYYSRTDMPREGYELCVEARKADGTARAYCLYAKYPAGKRADGRCGSYEGAEPEGTFSYNNCIARGNARGDGSTFGMACDLQYLQKTYKLMFGDLNSSTKLGGDYFYSQQYMSAVAETAVNRVVLKTAEANGMIVGSNVSIGQLASAGANKDRAQAYIHSKARGVKVLAIEVVDETHSAVVVDAAPFDTDELTIISAMFWESGFSSGVLGRTGSPCETSNQISSMKYPCVLNGIEFAVGGYETLGNAFMDIVDAYTRDIYVCNDASLLTTNVAIAKTTYQKSTTQMRNTKNNTWAYITSAKHDLSLGIDIATSAGETGSGPTTGYCDGLYFDAGTSGQREFLCLGNLWAGARSGLWCLSGHLGLSSATWTYLARLSYSGCKG